jgi:integrase
MAGDLADFRATLPERFAHDVMRALRQTLAAGVRYGYLRSNPAVAAGDNPAPAARAVCVYTIAELEALEVELGPSYEPLVPFGAATGLRPLELARVERRDVDRIGRILSVRGMKTKGSRRELPLTRRALEALDRIPPQLSTPLPFPSPDGQPLNPNTFRRRVWAPLSKRPGSSHPRGSTTCARRSPRTRSPPA